MKKETTFIANDGKRFGSEEECRQHDKKLGVVRDLGNGFIAVPRDAVTLNGHYLKHLNTMQEPYNGYWHIIAPNRRAIDSENGRPYLYRSIEEAQEDADRLAEFGEYFDLVDYLEEVERTSDKRYFGNE